MFKWIYNIIYLSTLKIRAILCGLYFNAIRCKLNPSVRNQDALGKSLVRFLQNSGPSFIKLGQILSTRPDLTGEIISGHLSLLQDKLPAFSFLEVRRAIEAEFGKTIPELFASFDENPVAAASIAQVHKAITHGGEEVAVKVLRPKVEARFAADIELITLVAHIANFLFGRALKNFKLFEVIATFKEIVAFELNLNFEAASADQIRVNCINDPEVRIPRVYWRFSGQRVLTTEWIHGTSLNNKEELYLKGHDPKEITQKIAITFFNQSFRDGLFHADLHPGNLMVDEDGRIVMIDFGIVGILPKRDRLFIAQILHGFLKHEYDHVSQLHFEAGYVPKTLNPVVFALALRSIAEPIIGLPVNKISIAHLLRKLFSTAKNFGMETQTQLILLQKTMVTLEGIGYSIYPDVNMWQLAEPWMHNWADETFNKRATLKAIKRESKKVVKLLPDIIEKLDNTLTTKTAVKRVQVYRFRYFWVGALVGLMAGYFIL